MNKRRLEVIIIIMLVAVSFFFCKAKKDEGTIAEESFGAAQVKVFKVKRQKISEKLFYTGLIEAQNKIVITPEVGGKITKIYVESGDMVRKGKLLAELDTRAIRLQLEQAQAALAVAKASCNDASRNMERMERLKQENAVSDQQYEKVKLAFDLADAQLKQAEAAVNLAKYSLNVSLMKAPFSGVIASKNADVGDVINPMMGGYSPSSGVVTLMDFSQVKIEIDVSYQDIVRIKKGQAAWLKVSAFSNKTFPGEVTVVSLVADPMTKKFKVEVRVKNPDLLLRPNTFGEVVLEVRTHEDSLVIPQKAVLKNSHVFLAKGNKAEKREVKIGLQNTDLVEILQGLEEGDLVIVEGNYGLENGAELEVKEVK